VVHVAGFGVTAALTSSAVHVARFGVTAALTSSAVHVAGFGVTVALLVWYMLQGSVWQH